MSKTKIMKAQNPKVLLTQDGLDKVKKELDELTRVKRPNAVDRVAKARDQGDLSENSEYTSARDELDLIETRITELENIIKSAQIFTGNNQANTVSLGSTVKVEFEDLPHEFMIVGSLESDPAKGKISNESPVGKALLGAKVGDLVHVTEIDRKYKIVEIKN